MVRRPECARGIGALLLTMWVGTACVTWVPAAQPLPDVVAGSQHIRITTVDSTTFQLVGTDSEPVRVEGDRLVGPLGGGTTSILLSDIAHVETVDASSRRRTISFAALVVVAIGGLLLLMGGVEAGRP